MTSKKPDIEALKRKAEDGDAEAQLDIGLYYLKGTGGDADYDKAIEWLEMSAKQDNVQAQMELGEFYRFGRDFSYCGEAYEYFPNVKFQDPDKSIYWYKKAALNDVAEAQFILGEIYEKGIEVGYTWFPPNREWQTEPEYCFAPIIEKAEKWYLLAARNNHVIAQYQLSLIYINGDGTVKDEVNSFMWLFRSAWGGCKEAQYGLYEFYASDSLFKPDIREAYIWLLISNKPDWFRDEFTEPIEKNLAKTTRISAQKEAIKRKKMIENQTSIPNFTDEEFEEWVMDRVKSESEPPEHEKNIEPKSRTNQTKKKPSQPISDDNIADDPEPSSGLAYKYVGNIRKNFDPSRVEFELVVPRKLKKTEDMDFTHIRIRYNKTNSDKKAISEYTRFRVNKAERKILICLAAQNSVSDKEKREENIRKILHEYSSGSNVSHLNRMFVNIFPNCIKTKSDRMLNRNTGLVNIKLSIDTTKIMNACDYDSCLL